MPTYNYSTVTSYKIGPDGKKTVIKTEKKGGGMPAAFAGALRDGASMVGSLLEAGGPHKSALDNIIKTRPSLSQRAEGLHDHGHPKPVSSGGVKKKAGAKSFQQLRDECLSSGKLFEDDDFPACDSTLFYSQKPPRPFEWKRPKEIVDDPQLMVGGASRFDIQQGELGDCWLLAAIAGICDNPDLVGRVIPSDQSFKKGEYAGIFHFEFYQYGEWVEVVVDDRLPTYYGRLVFMHSADNNEFWSALLEKAYAKLHGSYEALKGGSTCEAMEDFTGGVTEMFDLTQDNPNLYKIMQKARERKSLMGCSLEPDPNVVEAQLSNGLIRGHAYTITDVNMADIKTPKLTGKIPLIRIRNPWGNEAEWNGAWSDKSREWQFIPEDQRKKLGLQFDHDGEFWMAFQDFTKNFTKLEICNLGPDALLDDSDDNFQWKMSMFDGQWVKGCTAGGCRNYIDTFWTNPQFFINLKDVDEDDEGDKCTCIVGLMQKSRRKQRKAGVDMLTIGFAIYKIKDDQRDQPLNMDFFKYNASVGRSQSFINLREVNNRFKLPPGCYCIVPSTFEPNNVGDFLVRIFTEKAADSGEVDQETDIDTSVEPREPTTADVQQDDTVRKFFEKISGEDLEVDATELQQILDYALKKEFKFAGFPLEVCRSIIAIADDDRTGKLGFDEFKTLWTDIRWWKNVFKDFDKDKSGNLNGYELRLALNSVGFKLSSRVFKCLVLRYAGKDGAIRFDDFIFLAVKLKGMIKKYKQLTEAGLRGPEFDLNDWIETTLYS